MNDDYLWDKSGKPDPDIVELEQILGTLRYQPRPLEIAADVRPGRRFSVSRGLAIAAAVALVALGLGVWLGFQRQQHNVIVRTAPIPSTSPVSSAGNSNRAAVNPAGHDDVAPTSQIQVQSIDNNFQSGSRRPRLASNRNRTRPLETRQRSLSESEIAEARAAKDQLMMALRLASTKLNLVQKRTRGVGSENEVHNQHKIG